jgi:hypothetical protein
MPKSGIPAIQWGTFIAPGGVTHVAPVIDKHLMKGHRLAIQCQCGPTVEKGLNHLIVIHYVIH